VGAGDAETFFKDAEFALGDGVGKSSGEEGTAANGSNRPAINEVEGAEAGRGLDLYLHFAGSDGKEPGTVEGKGHGRSHAIQDGQEGLLERVEGWCGGVVGAAAKTEMGGRGCGEERGKDGLENEGGAASGADFEAIAAGFNGAGSKGEVAGVKNGALDGSVAKFGGGLDGGAMLVEEPGAAAACPQVEEAKGLAGDHREGEGGAENLSAAFALGAVDGEEHRASYLLSRTWLIE